jgi:hypothetical protein
MADEDGFRPDVPTSTAIVPSTHREAVKLARVISGDLPRNRGLFWCMTCGLKEGEVCKYPRGLTLDFDDDEMAALDGDPYNHQGPCPICGSQTLVSMEMMGGSDFSIRGKASANRRKEYGEAADVFFEKAQEKIGGMFAGVVPGSTLSDPNPSTPSGPSRDDLPDAADVDLSELKPRKG